MRAEQHALRIARTLLAHRLTDALALLPLENASWPYRWLARAAALVPTAATPLGVRLREALVELGPVFIKLGQMLSTRRDLLPAEIADELAELQDNVPPFSSDVATAIVEDALGGPLGRFFATFDPEPLASASIAQVHAATLPDGAEVVVKIVRPDIEPMIQRDMALLKHVAAQLDSGSEEARRLHLTEIVADHELTLMKELDLLQEADNTQQLRNNFAASPMLYVPQVHHALCRRNVLVLERIHGVPIADIAALEIEGTDFRVLAERGVETFFTQVFEHNFFHADMHPGNIFVDVTDPGSPSYIAIDCAIIGSLTEADQEYLARNLMAFFDRDYASVARLHRDSGWIPADVDAVAFERVIREVCDPIFRKPLNEISFGEFLIELFRTARAFRMEVQPQLVLLQKTLLYIEGLGRQLYPQLDLWETARPFMERWLAARMNPVARLQRMFERTPELIQDLPRLPAMVLETHASVAQLETQLAHQRRDIAVLKHTAARDVRRRRHRNVAALAALGAAALLWGPLAQAMPADTGTATSAAAILAALTAALLWRG